MENLKDNNLIIDVHVSVDCVLIGFDGERFRVLLVRQSGKQSDSEFNVWKLPGSLIYADEDLDEAAKRVLTELTGLKNIKMNQFKAYGCYFVLFSTTLRQYSLSSQLQIRPPLFGFLFRPSRMNGYNFRLSLWVEC